MKKNIPVNIDDLGLTPRETKFVCEYITNGYKAEEAAKTVGLLAKDAGSVASRLHCARLLQEDRIKAAIQRTKTSFVEPYKDVHYARIQEQLEIRAFYDVSDYFYPDGTVRPLDEIPIRKRCAIDEIKERWSMGKNGANERTVEYVMADRDKARTELRSLHETKEEEKKTDSTQIRDSILDFFKQGMVAGAKIKGMIDNPTVEKAPTQNASILAKKIKEGDYVLQEKK
jgi:phage terminase small subunit